MHLEHERELYRRALPQLLGRPGEFVLIGGGEVVAIYPSYDAALKAGYDKFGLAPFLVQQIEMVEQVHYLSRGGW